MTTRKIMLVDDHTVVRLGLTMVLEREGKYKVCCDASSLGELYEKVAESTPEMVIMDYKLPDGEGVTGILWLKKHYPDIKVIMLTAYTNDAITREAVLAGVDGYLLKDLDRKALLQSIDNVFSGTSSIDLARVKGMISNESKSLIEELSVQEEAILRYVAQGFTNKEIANQLYISEKTVRNYFSRVMRKIEVTNRTEAAIYWNRKSNAEL